MVSKWFKNSVFVACGIGAGCGVLVPGTVLGQAVERDVSVTGPGGATRTTDTVRGRGVYDRTTTVTGPRGNSVTRSFDRTRGPGGLQRSATVTGPRGNSITRNLTVNRVGPIGGFGPRWAPGPRFGPPVIIGGGGPGVGTALADFGIGAGVGAGLGLLTGAALASRPAPPPPVVVVPGGTYIAPAGTAPGPLIAQPPPRPVVVTNGFDPVADSVGRLKSWHENSRIDSCGTLGRLHDPRAVPALVDRLKNAGSKSVRIAAATAIGADPRRPRIGGRSRAGDHLRQEAGRARRRRRGPRAVAAAERREADREPAPRRSPADCDRAGNAASPGSAAASRIGTELDPRFRPEPGTDPPGGKHSTESLTDPA